MWEDNDQTLSVQDLVKFTHDIYMLYGYDFSGYSQNSYKRRVDKFLEKYHFTQYSELLNRLQMNPIFFNSFLEEVTVNVTEMFRDPEFFKTLRREVLPQLATYPMIRIWHAGCSSGEEVYSLAILLQEAGILDKSLIYATDINQTVLHTAKFSSFSADLLPGYEANYRAAGGLFKFSDYYSLENGQMVFHDYFKKRMVFAAHNLVIDQSFNAFNLILCRNVLIYFKRDLQNSTLKLFSESLVPLGFLVLGAQETLEFSTVSDKFVPVNKAQRIWQMKG